MSEPTQETMEAAVLRQFGARLELTPVAMPSPQPGEVLVRVDAVGLCGTDLKVIDGALPGLRLPVIPGHEVAGEIVAGGDPARHGLSVACYLYEPCGHCRWCALGAHALCPHAARVGRSRDGGLATHLVMREENVLPFEGIDPALAAVTVDAVATPWRALRVRAQLQPGEHLAITGAGGLGLNAIQIARDLGAAVAAVDPAEVARARALELGAELAVPPGQASTLREWSDGGVDVGLEASGRSDGFVALAANVRAGGRIVCCGYGADTHHDVASMFLVLSEISLLGSRASARDDVRAALDAVQKGRITPAIAASMPLDRVNDAIDMLRRGGLGGRLVIRFP